MNRNKRSGLFVLVVSDEEQVSIGFPPWQGRAEDVPGDDEEAILDVCLEPGDGEHRGRGVDVLLKKSLVLSLKKFHLLK